MTRNRDIAQILGLTEAENTTNASLGDGSGGGGIDSAAVSSIITADVDNAFVTNLGIGGGVTTHDISDTADILSVDNSTFADGSFHYLSGSNTMLYFDSDGDSFFTLDGTQILPWSSNGETYGYSVGGYTPNTANKQIQRFAFASDGNATDVGDLASARRAAAGASSSTHSYGAGGRVPSPGGVNTISKFAFANEATQNNLSTTLPKTVTQSSGAMSETHGFSLAGYMPSFDRDIFRWSFSSDTETATTHAQTGVYDNTYTLGISGPDYGYVVSGSQPSNSPNNSPTNNPSLYPNQNKAIEKFSYASENTINLHSKLDNLHGVGPSGSTSPTHGYVAGGKSIPGTGQVNFISKFPFAGEDVASDVGDLTNTRGHSTSAYSGVSGYAAGGSPSNSNTIDKYSFSTDGNATDVGDLVYDTYQGHGAQV